MLEDNEKLYNFGRDIIQAINDRTLWCNAQQDDAQTTPIK